MRTWNLITLVLVVIGALNWLLIGLFGFDLVAAITGNSFGMTSVVSRLIYTLVGLAGIWVLFTVLPMVSTTPEYRQLPSTST